MIDIIKRISSPHIICFPVNILSHVFLKKKSFRQISRMIIWKFPYFRLTVVEGRGRFMKKVVVTGALQFIGYHLSNRLLNAGYEVIGVDSLANRRERKEEMLLSFGRNANFQFIDSPWTEVELNKIICNNTKFIFHYDQETISMESTERIPYLCAENNIPLVVLSSLEVFGKQPTDVADALTLNPVTELGKQKARLEECLLSILEKLSYKLMVFRLPHVYGP